ncbi:ribosomal RNA-processing protein 7 homolog A [Puma concolor]|uniref:Ribosomal RNA-processing protein 7 homolog A n=1 Tax=Puma concolor TaxID=9696 RepID=A0A6P6I2J5_PUMCO|nr:ribosomal RNA-processing protein 7 homolog A [Puma concolor]
MVARRRKRGAQGSEQGIPSPPGYSAIPIKFSEKQQASHYLYVREHRVREGTKSSWPQKRTLFVLNVPPYCTEECLARLLSPCGPVQSVELQEKPDLADRSEEPKSKFFHPTPVRGFQVAYVVFQKPGGVSAALALKGPLLVSTDSHPVKSGVHSQYRGDVGHLRPGPWLPGGLGERVLALALAPASAGGRALQQVSECCSGECLGEVPRGLLTPPKPPSFTLGLWDLAQLRKKFEEDKQRIELMRAQRKFRPY